MNEFRLNQSPNHWHFVLPLRKERYFSVLNASMIRLFEQWMPISLQQELENWNGQEDNFEVSFGSTLLKQSIEMISLSYYHVLMLAT